MFNKFVSYLTVVTLCLIMLSGCAVHVADTDNHSVIPSQMPSIPAANREIASYSVTLMDESHEANINQNSMEKTVEKAMLATGYFSSLVKAGGYVDYAPIHYDFNIHVIQAGSVASDFGKGLLCGFSALIIPVSNNIDFIYELTVYQNGKPVYHDTSHQKQTGWIGILTLSLNNVSFGAGNAHERAVNYFLKTKQEKGF